LTFNSARSITVVLSSGLLVSYVKLELEKQFVSGMRWRRNSRRHGLSSSVRRLNSSVKLSSSRSVWRGRGLRRSASSRGLRKQLSAGAELKLNTRKNLSNKLNNVSDQPYERSY
jgi:hypothetical protein